MLVCLMIAMAIKMLAGRLEHDENNDFSRKEMESCHPSIGGFSLDLWIHQKSMWRAPLGNLSFFVDYGQNMELPVYNS